MLRNRSVIILIAIAAAAAVIAGLAIHGVVGGAILLALAVVLVVLTTALHTSGALTSDPRSIGLRAVVIIALAAIGLVKLFS